MNRAIAWFAENHVAANLLMALMVVGGITSLSAINQKSFPDIYVEVISIGVPYLGAAPEEVEEAVCVRIEEELEAIDGIERITSTANEGACGVSAELLSGYPVDRALTEVKNAVDSISTFPEDTEKPVISHFQVRRNALQLALSGDVPERTLKIWGERVRDEIAALPDVTQVELTGARPYEISIEVPEEALRRHGITFEDIVKAVRRGSLDRPGGSIKTRAGEVLLRTKGQAYTGEEFEKIVLLTHSDGTRLLLGEVATVIDGFEEIDRSARFDGSPAVIVRVFRVGEQRVLDLVASVKDYVASSIGRLPEGLSLSVWRDSSQGLRDRLDILIRNGRTGFILVFVVLAVFLRLRLAFWVAIGVPVAFVGALSGFPLAEISIDVISLFAFILVLGLLVDDAIVVGENIHRHQETGENALSSAIRGAQEVSVPVIFGVLTTVAAFMPLVVSPGPFGQIFGAIGATVMLCLIFSLVESQLVLPSHLGHMKIDAELRERRGNGGDEASRGGIREAWKRIQRSMATSLSRLAREHYRPALDSVLAWRYTALAAGVAILMLTVALIATGGRKFSFFPKVDSDYVTAQLTLSPGAPVEITTAAVAEIEAAALRLRSEIDAEFGTANGSVIQHVLSTVGEQSGGQRGALRGAGGSRSNLGEVALELLGGELRPISAEEVAKRWRTMTPAIPGTEELTFRSSLFHMGSPIDVQLISTDVEQLKVAAEKLKEKLARYPGVFDIADSFRDGKEEIRLSLLPMAEPLGVTLEELSGQVRQAFYGEEAQRIQRGRDDIRVMVRYPKAQRRSIDDLQNLRIRTESGAEVPIYTVARIERGRGYASIKRADRQRVINVTSDLNLVEANANEILNDLQAGFLPGLVADHPGLSFAFGGEQREQRKTLGALLRSYGFAMILIYVLLAIPLRSYLQPLIIMSVIPFGLVGAIAGHLLMGMQLSMMSIFGIVALSGVVVNSSLVLVHYVNHRRKQGDELLEAVCEAGVARFRPIVLTSLTTFAGLTPLLLEKSLSAQFLIPMATSLAFGVVFASAISLFLVPSLYLILEDLKRVMGRAEPTTGPVHLEVIEGGADVRAGDPR